MVAASLRKPVQNADFGGPRPTRLPARRIRGVPTLHHAAAAESSVQNALFPRRRPLGAQASEQPTLVQNSEWLGGFVFEEMSFFYNSERSEEPLYSRRS